MENAGTVIANVIGNIICLVIIIAIYNQYGTKGLLKGGGIYFLAISLSYASMSSIVMSALAVDGKTQTPTSKNMSVQ